MIVDLFKDFFLKIYRGWLYIKILFVVLYMIILNLFGEIKIFGIKECVNGYFFFWINENIIVWEIVWFIIIGFFRDFLILIIVFLKYLFEIKKKS